MKTLILYSTKHGASKEIANLLAKKIPGANIFDLKKNKIPQLSRYECVVIGGSIYAGMLRSETKNYIKTNLNELCSKRIGLFISACDENQNSHDVFFKNNFPEEILRNVKVKASLGGIFDPFKVGFFSKALFKAVTKQADYINTVTEDRINNFVETLMK